MEIISKAIVPGMSDINWKYICIAVDLLTDRNYVIKMWVMYNTATDKVCDYEYYMNGYINCDCEYDEVFTANNCTEFGILDEIHHYNYSDESYKRIMFIKDKLENDDKLHEEIKKCIVDSMI